MIGPRLNTSGSYGDPSPGLELLRAFDESEAQIQLDMINQANDERRAMVNRIFTAIQLELDSLTDLPELIILADAHWSRGS